MSEWRGRTGGGVPVECFVACATLQAMIGCVGKHSMCVRVCDGPGERDVLSAGVDGKVTGSR